MIIPNDMGHPWRLNKFVEYQHKVPPIGPATYLAFANETELSEDDCILLAWYNSMSYCEITAIYLLKELRLDQIQQNTVENFWRDNKEKLIFASARRYVKNMDWFCPLMNTFVESVNKNPTDWLYSIAGDGTPQQRYKNVYNYLIKWKFMGRFSVELFMDALVQFSRENLISVRFQAEDFEWKKGSNITSGMLNMFYYDDLAEEYDKTGKLKDSTIILLNELIVEVQKAVKSAYPEQDVSISVITPKMCSWRNLFKGTRYGGYHHDRQLEQLLHYTTVYPEDILWKYLFGLRKRIFVPELLGELNGWTGIRKERKKLWLTKGLTGVEVVN